jgi:ribosomal protein L11 methylase PrmA
VQHRWGSHVAHRCRAKQAFERNWFVDRRCLDVGCNEGVVTMAVACKFRPRSMLGVDIDESLVRKACTALANERHAAVQRLQELRGSAAADAAEQRRTALATMRSLGTVWFQQVGSRASRGTAPQALQGASLVA